VIWRAIHRGEFMGLPPTNQPVGFEAFHLVRFSAGRATECWGTADLLGAMQQVGGSISPSPG
jgi:predicted ester cyclase